MSKVIFEAYIDTIVGLLKMILHATRYNSSMYVCTAYSLHNGLKSKKKLFAAIKPYGSAKGQRKNPYNVDFPAISLIFNCIIFPFRIHFELM